MLFPNVGTVCRMPLKKTLKSPSTIGDPLKAKHKEVDPFIIRKWERIFNAIFDSDSSHEVDWADFYIIMRKVRNIYGAESAQMQYAKSALTALWEGLLNLADKNKDEKVQLEEWINMLNSSDPKKQMKWFTDYATAMFKLFDVSADEKIDLAEYTDGMETYGLSHAEAHEAFQKFSVDSKGKYIPSIDFKQFMKLWHEYFYSADPKSHGNYLFGPNFT